MSYERVVSAALAETKSKFALAEALALDIPPRRQGGDVANERSVMDHLDDAQLAIIRAGGEPRTIKTLARYRETALWVMIESSPLSGGTFRWIRDVSFTAHSAAREAGLSYEEFASMPVQTIDAVNQQRPGWEGGTDGHAHKAVPPTPQQVADAVRNDEDAAQAARAALGIDELDWIDQHADDRVMRGEDDTEEIREALRDPDKARAVLEDPQTAAALARAQHERHERIRDAVAPPGSEQERVREGMDRRYQALDVIELLIRIRPALRHLRQSAAKLAELGTLTPFEMESIVDDAKQTLDEANLTLPTIEFLAQLSPDKLSIGDEVAAWLGAQS